MSIVQRSSKAQDRALGVWFQQIEQGQISFDLLSKAHCADLGGAALKEKLTKDFDRFLRDRASLIVAAMESLAAEASPSIEALWSSHQATKGGVTA